MTQNNKKNRPANATATAAKPPVPAAEGQEAEQPIMETAKVEAEDTAPHPLDKAMDAFVAACAAYVDDAKSPRSTVVGSYRIAFNGPQVISVIHN